jgi:pyrimidine-nucleoside phosphorylase
LHNPDVFFNQFVFLLTGYKFMNPLSVIANKRDGYELSTEEIRYFINGFTRGDIPDYQAASWLMAVFIRGMTPRETTDLTLAMAESGEILDLSEVLPFSLDKHSSGGVGDKTSLVVLPLVVACGVPVAKMSGRGLDFSGGTLDKLESIEGFNTQLTRQEFMEHARQYGIVLSGQTGDLAPADGKIYALRDVTGTVPSLPLIASSIMSKKIAAGADAIVLDVKSGHGAFMETVDQARELAEAMVRIGVGAGRRVTALISDMNQPLGNAVGNALEIRETIATLRNQGPSDFVEHCLTIAGHMLRLAGKSHQKDLSDVRPLLEAKLADGSAWEKFYVLVEAQGGNVKQIENPDLLPTAPVIIDVPAPEDAVISGIDAREVGLTALDLGAGRLKKGQPVDHAVGVVVHGKVGDRIQSGDTLVTVHAQTQEAAQSAGERLLRAHKWGEAAEPLPLFYDAVFSDEIS